MVESVLSLAFHSPSGQLGFIGPGLLPEFWDIASGQRAFSFGGDGFELASSQDLFGGVVRGSGGGRGGIMALSLDGSWLAQNGTMVRVWDVEKRELLLVLPEEPSVPWCFAWSPDRKLLAVGSPDGGLQIWNMPIIRSQLAEIGLDW
jgi:WD40 repeat protein